MRLNLLLVFIVILFFFGTTSAFQTSAGETLAYGEIHTGDPVTAKSVIDFPPRGAVGTFPADHDLLITTRLENPQWTYYLILDGVKNPEKTVTTEHLTLSGFELNYPADVRQSVVVIVNGTAPDVSRITMTSVMDIREIDSSGQAAENSSRSDSQLPIHPRMTTTPSPVPTPQKSSPALLVVLLGITGACGVLRRVRKRHSAGFWR
jgi:hypothetical protein